MPPYLRPMGPTAATAILCGDPARSLLLAQHVIAEPRMSNHHRGLWGYHGLTSSGTPLSVQTTGIGGPSAALVLTLLGKRGLRAAIRVGSCRAALGEPPLATTVAATSVLAEDGASRAYGAAAGARLAPDGALSERLLRGCDAGAELVSRDRPLEPGAGGGSSPPAPREPLYDMQSAALLAAAEQSGVRLGICAVVARNANGPLDDEPLEAAMLGLAGLAAAALAAEMSAAPTPG